jgi:hypothetical protein
MRRTTNPRPRGVRDSQKTPDRPHHRSRFSDLTNTLARCNDAGSSVESCGVAKLFKNVKFLKNRDIGPKALKKIQKSAKKIPSERQLE